jgi:thioredoxin-related protein
MKFIIKFCFAFMALLLGKTGAKCLEISHEVTLNEGIDFKLFKDWEAVLKESMERKKTIMIDFYTTWCGPCKMMDANVFSDKSLGTLINEDFIAIKIQIDSTNTDDEHVRSWYTDSRLLKNRYSIEAFPTTLFLSPDGNLIFKSIGYKNAANIIKIAKFASDPQISRQLNDDIAKFHNGSLALDRLADLPTNVKDLIGDEDLALAIAQEYKQRYLDKIPSNSAITKENLDYICKNGGSKLLNSNDDYFKFAYNHPAKLDSIVQGRVAYFFVTGVIKKEEIDSRINELKASKQKDKIWMMIEKNIQRKFPKADAKQIVISAEKNFYFSIGDWDNYTKFRSIELLKYPLTDTDELAVTLQLNEPAWQVFLSTSNKNALKRAIAWSEKSILMLKPNSNPEFYDTKANLLYKLGHIKEAIATQELAVKLYKESMAGKEIVFKSNIEDNLSKMKSGIPTWQ